MFTFKMRKKHRTMRRKINIWKKMLMSPQEQEVCERFFYDFLTKIYKEPEDSQLEDNVDESSGGRGI